MLEIHLLSRHLLCDKKLSTLIDLCISMYICIVIFNTRKPAEYYATLPALKLLYWQSNFSHPLYVFPEEILKAYIPVSYAALVWRNGICNLVFHWRFWYSARKGMLVYYACFRFAESFEYFLCKVHREIIWIRKVNINGIRGISVKWNVGSVNTANDIWRWDTEFAVSN